MTPASDTPQPDTGKQPERHCDHERVCVFANQVGGYCPHQIGKCPHDTRSQPLITPALEYEKYTGVCALQDECNEYADFIESIIYDLDDPDDEDPICPIKCELRKDPQQQAERESALIQRTREEVLAEFKWMKPACFGRHDAECDTKCAWVVRERCIQSLRSQPPTTGSIPHICKTCGKSCRERRSDSECICGSWEGSTTSPAKGKEGE